MKNISKVHGSWTNEHPSLVDNVLVGLFEVAQTTWVFPKLGVPF